MAGAAIGTDPKSRERAQALIAAGVDVICIDTAHGHSKNVIEMVKWVAQHSKDVILVAGNVVTADGTTALIEAGCDVVKIGVGPEVSARLHCKWRWNAAVIRGD